MKISQSQVVRLNEGIWNRFFLEWEDSIIKREPSISKNDANNIIKNWIIDLENVFITDEKDVVDSINIIIDAFCADCEKRNDIFFAVIMIINNIERTPQERIKFAKSKI